MREPPKLLAAQATTPPRVQQPTASAVPRSKAGWNFVLGNRAAMFGMLFCVTGFLGIPLLWMSRKFSHREKVIWSVVVTIYTLALIGIAVAICWWSYSQISQSLNF